MHDYHRLAGIVIVCYLSTCVGLYLILANLVELKALLDKWKSLDAKKREETMKSLILVLMLLGLMSCEKQYQFKIGDCFIDGPTPYDESWTKHSKDRLLFKVIDIGRYDYRTVVWNVAQDKFVQPTALETIPFNWEWMYIPTQCPKARAQKGDK